MLVEGGLRLEITERCRALLIVDASESAAEHRERIARLVAQVLSELPADAEITLNFLGSSERRPAGAFSARASEWLDANRTRASLLTPNLSVLPEAAPPPVVIVGSGPIYDLEDWSESRVLDGAVFCSIGRSLREGLASGACRGTELTDPPPSQLVQRIHNPVARLRITGLGFMPVRWNHAGLRLVLSAGGAVLEGENLGRAPIMVRYHAPEGERPTAEATRANGASERLPTDDVAPQAVGLASAEGLLSPAECEVFQRARAGQAFTCPVCGETHAAETTRCLAGHSILGVPVYPSLPSGGFAALSAAGAEVSYRMFGSDTLPLTLDRVAVRDRLRATVHAYNPDSMTWAPVEPFAQYTPLGGDAYAVFV